MMSLETTKPPFWVWPARIAGLLSLLLGLALPGGYVWLRSTQALPPDQAMSQKDLRPTMLVLPLGTFQMGSADSDRSRAASKIIGHQWMDSEKNERSGYEDERPLHEVELTRRFAISETEVTQGQYQAVVGTNPALFKNLPGWQQLPVENVSWLDAIEYCNKLSQLEGHLPCYQINGRQVQWEKGLDCPGYRLPTEAEWEYAARGDEKTTYAGSNLADEVAWYGERLKTSSTHAVKGKQPNQWGLYDMSGNVWEWVWDWYSPYPPDRQENPSGTLPNGTFRVVRGGSWLLDTRNVRVAIRFRYRPDDRLRDLGFRLARSYP